MTSDRSVRPAIGRLLLNVDTVTALLYRPGPLLDVALSYLGKRNPRDLANLPITEFNRLRAFLKGVRVTIQTARSDRARPISNLVTNAGAYEFEKDGSPTTVQEYYRQVYNVQLRYPSIFGIRIGRDAVFPIELCNIEKGQLYRKKIPAEIGPDFLSFSTQKPHDRLQTIEAAISGPNQLFNYDVSDFMQEAGLQIDRTPLLVQGRVMPTPAIQYRGSSLDKSGAWNVVRKQFLSPKPIEAWAVVNFDPRASGDNRARFLSKLSENLQALGVQIRLPPIIDAGNPNQVADSIERVARRAHPEGKAPTIVIAFLPSSGAEIRREIKHWGDIRRYVPTQCVRAGKWERVSDQYCNNVALKINAKIGGINSKIIPTLSGLKALVPPRTMVIGADIGHPGPGVSNRPSMTSLVTSLNDDCTQYAAFSAIQEPRVEIIANLQAMLKDAIYQYLWHNDGQYPQRIVFFRDGVSEGEYARVARDEIESINSCLVNLVGFQKNGEPVKDGTKVYAPGKKPPVTFIVVGKRHHIRFFPTSRENADRSGNCPPGFVVDNEITGTAFPNYYLQSHSGIQGTSRPSHYIILRNEIGLPVETCQRLSFDLCHVYASATRSVSIPAPVYYADRVCARADFHYRPDLRFGDTDSGIGTDSSVFDLQKWEDGFKPAGLPALRKMYFL
ncbi:hypothetical protein EVJ58_g3223 [Rhodofomes roseus]|uniref:Piwi domain-containing protein n=1 Tax=Rhodofomes roseus TaxID=34475 RepID=A0A4Y9YNZ5_9APHY|nr:hypothetical protein EVJ58_g3223 [Rhodofomes roseus]